MKFQCRLFNLYLILLTGVVGCKTAEQKETTMMGFQLEANRDGSDRNGPVTIGRSASFVVNVERDAFLSESMITEAAVVPDSLGGFMIRVQFNRRGTWLLEQYSVASKGKRVAINCHWGKEKARWIAAPLLDKRISDGSFVFTPDVSKEEAERIVRGLNNSGKEVKKDDR